MARVVGFWDYFRPFVEARALEATFVLCVESIDRAPTKMTLTCLQLIACTSYCCLNCFKAATRLVRCNRLCVFVFLCNNCADAAFFLSFHGRLRVTVRMVATVVRFPTSFRLPL